MRFAHYALRARASPAHGIKSEAHRYFIVEPSHETQSTAGENGTSFRARSMRQASLFRRIFEPHQFAAGVSARGNHSTGNRLLINRHWFQRETDKSKPLSPAVFDF
jgi:hypothetical protein